MNVRGESATGKECLFEKEIKCSIRRGKGVFEYCNSFSALLMRQVRAEETEMERECEWVEVRAESNPKMISMEVDNGQRMWVWVAQQHWPDVNSYVWHFNECLPLFHSTEWDCTYGTNSMRIRKKRVLLLFITLHCLSFCAVCATGKRWTVIIFVFYGTACMCCPFVFFFANGHRTILGQRMNSEQSKGNQSKIAKEQFVSSFAS